MRIPKRRTTLALGISVHLVLAISARPQGRLYEEVDVQLVEIDVTVVDRRGRSVDDLSREAFQVLIDGEFTAIEGFTAPGTNGGPDPPQTAGSSDALSAPRGNLVLYVDAGNVDPQRATKVLEQVRATLESSEGNLRYMLVEARPGGSRTLHALDDSPRGVARALGEITLVASSDRASQLREIARSIERLLSHEIALTRSSREAHVQLVGARINAYSAAIGQETHLTMTNLGRLVDAVGGLPGGNAIVYIGAGIPLNPGASLLNALRSANQLIPSDGSSGGQQTNVGIGSADDSSHEMAQLALHASVYGVEIHSIDIGSDPRSLTLDMSRRATLAEGAARPGEESLAPELSFAQRVDLASLMESLAEATGGRAFKRNNDLEPALEAIAGRGRPAYTLTVRPAGDPTASPGSIHSIDVTVDRRRVQVNHRQSFRYLTDDERAARRLTSALLSPADVNPLEINVDVQPTEMVSETGRTLIVAIDIPLEHLAVLADGDAHRGQLSIYLAPGSGALVNPEISKLVLPIRIPNEDVFAAMGQSIAHRAEIDLTDEMDRLAVAVRDDLGSVMSVVTVPTGLP